MVEWDIPIPRMRQSTGLRQERTRLANEKRDVKGKGKEVIKSRKRPREESVEQDVDKSEACDSPVWSPERAEWKDPEV